MNFPNNFRKLGFIFLICLSLTISKTSFLIAQYQDLGLPLAEHLTPPAYFGLHPYNSATIDHYGFLFLSGNNGVFHFDGSQWEPVFIPGKPCLSFNESGEVFVAGNNAFGKILYRNDGSVSYSPLVNDSIDPEQVLGHASSIQCIENQVFILTNTGLHLWDNNQIQYNIVDGRPIAIFEQDNTIHYITENAGLFQYHNGNSNQVADIKAPGMQSKPEIYLTQNILFTFTEEIGLQQWQNQNLLPPVPGTSNIFTRNKISSIALLPDETFAFAIESGGLILQQGSSYQTLFREENGLHNNQINNLLNDHSGNIWVVHDNGLTRIEWPSPLTLFNKKNGLRGNVNEVIRHRDKLYTATSKGVFCLEEKSSVHSELINNIFVPVSGINSSCNQFIHVEKELFVKSDFGLYHIIGHDASLVLEAEFNTLIPLSDNPDYILGGTNSGLTMIEVSDDGFNTNKVINNFSLPVIQLSSGKDRIWWTTPQSQIYYTQTANLTSSKPESADYNVIKDFPVEKKIYKILNADQEILFLTSEGLYRYSTENAQILPYQKLPDPLLQNNGIQISNIWNDSNNNLWLQVNYPNRNENTIFRLNQTGKDKIEMNPVFDRRFNARQINSVYSNSDEIAWICCNELLARFNMTYYPDLAPTFYTYISKVIIQKDSSVFYPFPRQKPTEHSGDKYIRINHSHNDISFEFSSNHLSGSEFILYQHKLKGNEENWSGWEPVSFVSYHNLPRGHYIFEVRSKDMHGTISNMASLSFRIQPPLFFSWWTIIIYSFVLLIGIYLFQKWRAFVHLQEKYRLEEIVEERTESLLKEKEKSDNLLANILPKKTADEIMAKGKASSSKFKMVTVLFSDIQGFTKIAEQMNPDLLIDELDQFYFQFDSVVEKYNIEKIKTIGDAYMAAGGIPIKNRTNPVEVVLAALEMLHYMKDLKKTKTDIWDLRIGIHTGSVIAGVVGQKKLSYDIWGDTVNTASRMESSGEVGKVNVSATTYELIKDFFDCEYRGKMPVKYKGDIEMYFVKGLKPSLRENNKDSPNQEFQVLLQMLRLLDLEEFVMEKLNEESPENLYFHTSAHTSHVYTQVEILGRSEHVQTYDLLLLRSAALLHDIGYIHTIDNHEEKSVEMAREILPLYRYPEHQIDQICDLIMATKLETEPQTLIQQIIYDANLDHIGRVDFLIQSDKLYQEMRALNKIKSKKEWNEQQIKFLNTHDFYTEAAQKLREVSKEQQIRNIREFS